MTNENNLFSRNFLPGLILTGILILSLLIYQIFFEAKTIASLLVLSIVFLIIIIVFLWYVFYSIRRAKKITNWMISENNLITLNYMEEQLKMAVFMTQILDCIRAGETKSNWPKINLEINNELNDIQNQIREFRSDLDNNLVNEGSAAQKIIDIKKRMEKVKNVIQTEGSVCTETYLKSKISEQKANNNMTTLIYYLGVSIPILTDFTKIFNEFSKDLILQVINQFGEITHSSHEIATDIENSMNALMDENKHDSLAYIIKKAHDLVVDFEQFYHDMESLKMTTDEFTEKTSEKLQNIQGIADSIEQIAETIKVLSLNVSIEAANTGSAGKGFQVLARDLREFTTKTMKFAHEVKSRVKDALITTDNLKTDYVQSMQNVYQYMENIKNSIRSFEVIIQTSFDALKVIIKNMNKFSNSIDSGIKDVVGKLQYYDITSQEVDHLGLFIEKIFMDLFNNKMNFIQVSDYLSDEEKTAVKKNILGIISEIITTSSERKILNKYEKNFGIKLQEEIKIDNKAGADIKGENENIILF